MEYFYYYELPKTLSLESAIKYSQVFDLENEIILKNKIQNSLHYDFLNIEFDSEANYSPFIEEVLNQLLQKPQLGLPTPEHYIGKLESQYVEYKKGEIHFHGKVKITIKLVGTVFNNTLDIVGFSFINKLIEPYVVIKFNIYHIISPKNRKEDHDTIIRNIIFPLIKEDPSYICYYVNLPNRSTPLRFYKEMNNIFLIIRKGIHQPYNGESVLSLISGSDI